MPFYSAKMAIAASVRAAVPEFYGTVLDVGCGVMPYRELVEEVESVERYIGMDIPGSALYGHVQPDITWDGLRIPLDDRSVDCVMATEFLEHHADPDQILGEMARVIKDGGRFFATVPFIWNLHELPSDEFRYTPFSLRRLLECAGFEEIQIKALGGWNLALAQMLGLWVTFSRMHRFVRKVLSIGLFPFFMLLVRTDTKPVVFDGAENSMFTGLSVSAIKKPR